MRTISSTQWLLEHCTEQVVTKHYVAVAKTVGNQGRIGYLFLRSISLDITTSLEYFYVYFSGKDRSSYELSF